STTKRAQSRRKQLQKMEKIDRPLGDEASASFSFQTGKRSGNDVLKIEQLAFRYEDDNNPLFTNVTLPVTRAERIALVGQKGVGKSTIIKVILGKLKSDHGHVQIGTNVETGSYDQEQANITSVTTVLQDLWDEYPMVNERDIRTVLGNFLFSGDDDLKHVHP